MLISELLENLKTNRGKHLEIVEEAQAEFRKRAIEELDRMLAAAKEGRQIQMRVGLQVPSQHTDEYDNAINLLEMMERADETKVEISADECERFVRDNWEWTGDFNASNRGYSDKVGI